MFLGSTGQGGMQKAAAVIVSALCASSIPFPVSWALLSLGMQLQVNEARGGALMAVVSLEVRICSFTGQVDSAGCQWGPHHGLLVTTAL